MDEEDRRLLRRIDTNVRALLRLAGAEASSLAVLTAGAESTEESMATLQEITADLVTKVEPLQDAVEASVATLDTLGARVLELVEQVRTNGMTAEIEAELQAVGTAMTTGATELVAAAFRNTPAEPTPEPTPEPEPAPE